MSDSVKPEAGEVVDVLHSMGIKVAMLTGDNERTAKAIAEEVWLWPQSRASFVCETLPTYLPTYVSTIQFLLPPCRLCAVLSCLLPQFC